MFGESQEKNIEHPSEEHEVRMCVEKIGVSNAGSWEQELPPQEETKATGDEQEYYRDAIVTSRVHVDFLLLGMQGSQSNPG